MARILLYTLVFSPDGVSTAQLLTDLAVDLQALGHEVTVLTTTPHFNVDAEARARQPLGRRWGALLQESRCGGIPVYHVRMRDKGKRVLARLVDYAGFHGVSLVAGAVLGEGFDLVLAPSPPLTIGLGAWLIGLMRRAPFVYNVQEIYPDVAIRLGVLRNRSLIRLMYRLERFTYRRARRVVVISERFRRDLLAKGVPDEKLVVIPNFVDTDFIRPMPRRNSFSASHGLDERFVVLYAGNLGLTQGLETVLEAAASLAARPEVRFLLVGDGARRAWLERRGRGPRAAERDAASLPAALGGARDVRGERRVPGSAQGRDGQGHVPVEDLHDHGGRSACDRLRRRGLGAGVGGARGALRLCDPARRRACPRGRHHRRAGCTQDLAAMGRRGRDYVVSNHSRAAVAAQYDALIREVVAERGR